MLQIFQDVVQLFSMPPCHKHLLHYKSCSHAKLRETNISALQREKMKQATIFSRLLSLSSLQNGQFFHGKPALLTEESESEAKESCDVT